MKKALFVLLGLLMVGSLLMAACQPKATEAPAEEAPVATEEAPVATEEAPVATEEAPVATEAPVVTEEVIKGGTLNWMEAGVVQFDPPFIADDSSMHVVSQVFSFLFRLTADGQILPDLAESWEYENDGKTVVFHLRQGVMFQDGNAVFAEGAGREVVAQDVAYSLERQATIEGSQTAADFIGSFESAEVVDDYTVKLHLTAPDALLFVAGRGITAVGILPQEAVEQLGEDWKLSPIGSGPFEFQEYIPDDSVILVPNEDYRVVPNIDQMIFKVLPDESVAAISLEAGEIDAMGTISTSIYDQFASNEDFTIIDGNCPASFNIQFNMNDPLVGQKEVREAIAHAVDGHSIVNAVVGGLWVDGCGTAGPGIPGFDAELCDKYFIYDTELAAQILTDAGWAKNADGIWEKDGTPLALQMELWNMTPMPDIAAAVLTQLQEFGISVELTQVEFGTWIDDYFGGTGKPIMFWSGFCGDGGLNGYWGRTGLAAAQGFANEEVFTLLDEANVIVDPVERNATLMQATDLIFQDYPDIPLGFFSGAEIVNKRVNDYHGLFWFMNIVTDTNNVWLSQ